MLRNSALEASPRDAESQQAVAHELTMIERIFHCCFVAGQTPGEIPARHTADDAARHRLSVSLGIPMLARFRPERELPAGVVPQALKKFDLLSLVKAQSRIASAVGRTSYF
jgi:TetR/AcrR family transcriptional repressor of nem operon